MDLSKLNKNSSNSTEIAREVSWEKEGSENSKFRIQSQMKRGSVLQE